MESIVDMEWKHKWGPSQKVVHGTVHGMGAFHPSPYGFHMESTGECKDLGYSPNPIEEMMRSRVVAQMCSETDEKRRKLQRSNCWDAH